MRNFKYSKNKFFTAITYINHLKNTQECRSEIEQTLDGYVIQISVNQCVKVENI